LNQGDARLYLKRRTVESPIRGSVRLRNACTLYGLADTSSGIRQEIARIRKAIEEGEANLSAANALALLSALESLARHIDLNTRANWELGDRLLAIENSRLFLILRRAGVLFNHYKRRVGQLLLHSPLHRALPGVQGKADGEYALWLEREEQQDAARPDPEISCKPLFSVLMPVHNPRREWLEEAAGSVLAQSYPNWQLCICDDASSESWVPEYLGRLASADSRVRFVRSEAPLGISGALNKAAGLASGDFLGFLDHDDKLAAATLEALAGAVQQTPPDLLYTDEDRLNAEGVRVQPIFRPDWSPDLLTSCMYMGHFLAVSRSAWERSGGFRQEYDGAQDFDLALRIAEFTTAVRHIPRVLYHWRMHPGSTASSAESKPGTHDAGRRALQDAMKRRGRDARVEDGPIPNRYRVRPAVTGDPLASIVICSRNAARLALCLKGIEASTAYSRREIVVVQHKTGGDAQMEALLSGSRCVRVPFSGSFHYSRMNNAGAAAAHGEALIFLNDDVLPLAPDWLELLMGHLQRPETGAVGAKLLYPSGAVQHVGIALGLMGGVGHPFRGTFGSPYWHWLDCARNVSAVTGACLGIRKKLFQEFGGFDESFPVNFNDVDLCLRLRAAGYSIICEPSAILRHDECGTRMPGVASKEKSVFLSRYAELVDRGDPFYHPALNRNREDASLGTD
jgi:O-antigen biosynthesis protein